MIRLKLVCVVLFGLSSFWLLFIQCFGRCNLQPSSGNIWQVCVGREATNRTLYLTDEGMQTALLLAVVVFLELYIALLLGGIEPCIIRLVAAISNHYTVSGPNNTTHTFYILKIIMKNKQLLLSTIQKLKIYCFALKKIPKKLFK